MFGRILVPVDGSPPSDAAIDLAIRLARFANGTIVLCHVQEVVLPVADAAGFATEQLVEEAASAGSAILEEAKRRVADAGVSVDTTMRAAPVADAIVDAVRQLGIDVIVMGSHGRAGLARAVLGSRTEDVLRRSPVPVLVAPHAG